GRPADQRGIHRPPCRRLPAPAATAGCRADRPLFLRVRGEGISSLTMYVLRQLPFSDAPYTVPVAGEEVAIRAYQIVVWLSLGARDVLEKDAKRFPAVLDTGHTHNLSIRDNQLLPWAGVEPDSLAERGSILVNREEVPLRAAHLWIHRNRPGTAELLPRPFR